MEFGKKQLGNWIITKYNKGGVPFIKIKPVSGEFAWEYSSLDKKFIEIESAIDDETSCEALKECFAIDAELLHNETGIFHLVYMKSMDLLYHLGSQRNINTEENVSNAILEAFNAAKARIDELYGGRIDHSIVTDADDEALKEMRITDELSEELKKEDVEANSVDDMYEKVGATLDKSDLSIPANENIEATEAWSVESGEEFEFKNE